MPLTDIFDNTTTSWLLGPIVRSLHEQFPGESWTHHLPLVSQTLFTLLQNLSLAVMILEGEKALTVLRNGKLAAEDKRAWCAHTIDLQGHDLHRITPVIDVSALAGCASLHTLILDDCKLYDASPLAGCSSLHTLDLSGTGVTDVSQLAGCSSLHTLALSRTSVTDVSQLAGLIQLYWLDLSRTLVTDVSALARCSRLSTLLLYRTQVNDVSDLARSNSLVHLDIEGTLVTDVSPLAGCISLRRIEFDYTQHGTTWRGMTLKSNNSNPLLKVN